MRYQSWLRLELPQVPYRANLTETEEPHKEEIVLARQDAFHFVRSAVKRIFPSLEGVDSPLSRGGPSVGEAQRIAGQPYQNALFTYSNGFLLVEHAFQFERMQPAIAIPHRFNHWMGVSTNSLFQSDIEKIERAIETKFIEKYSGAKRF